MAQIFPPASNALARASLYGAALIVVAVAWMASAIDRSSLSNDQGVVRQQPVPFSHEHHVSGLGLDCRYCHTSVENSSFAGMPSTKTCMTCHSQIWVNAQILAPVRRSWQTNQPLRWERVHNLPNFVYFNHSIHLAKGIGCNTCHGPVDRMPLTYQASSLQMDWCLNCHRNPEKYIRPKSEVFNMGYQYPKDQLAFGKRLVEEYHVSGRQLTDCYVCHR